MATYRSVCSLCSVVLNQTKYIVARPPKTTTGCSARAYTIDFIVLREGRQTNDRHIFAWPESQHTHRYVCYVRWPGPRIHQDHFRSSHRCLVLILVAGSLRPLSFGRVGESKCTALGQSKYRWIPTQDACGALEVRRVIPGVFKPAGHPGWGDISVEAHVGRKVLEV